MQAALMKATDNVGQAFVEMHKLKGESGRESYLELKSYYYGNLSVEDQKTTILTDIAKIKYQGSVGKSFEDCCGDLRTLHQALEDINRAHSAERKVRSGGRPSETKEESKQRRPSRTRHFRTELSARFASYSRTLSAG